MGTAILWGAGTALGEIPPYAFSYHAAKAGLKNEEWDDLFQVTQAADGQRRERGGLIRTLVARMKNWMLKFIETCAGALRDPGGGRGWGFGRAESWCVCVCD